MTNNQYFKIIAEIDCLFYLLSTMLEQEKKLSAFEKLIDKSTGFEEHKLKAAKRYVKRIKFLQGKLPPDDPHFKK